MKRTSYLFFPLALFLLAPAGCDSIPDEPLPSFEELRQRFGSLPPGEGRVEDSNDLSFETNAFYYVLYEQTENPSFAVEMSIAEQVGVRFTRDGITASDLEAGMQFEDAEISYGPGEGHCGGGGAGRLEIVAVEDSLIAGVFAADVRTHSEILQCGVRVQGGFNAVFAPPEE